MCGELSRGEIEAVLGRHRYGRLGFTLGGGLAIESQAGGGTRVLVRIPRGGADE